MDSERLYIGRTKLSRFSVEQADASIGIKFPSAGPSRSVKLERQGPLGLIPGAELPIWKFEKYRNDLPNGEFACLYPSCRVKSPSSFTYLQARNASRERYATRNPSRVIEHPVDPSVLEISRAEVSSRQETNQ